VAEGREAMHLARLDVPCVDRVAVIAGRTDAGGEPLPAALVTSHLRFPRAQSPRRLEAALKPG
jgi:hypothetical protein